MIRPSYARAVSAQVEFERRVWAGLHVTPPHGAGARDGKATQLFWDQNLFNKVLLSFIAKRPLHLPDGSTDAWDAAHGQQLWDLGRPWSWNLSQPEQRAPTPLAARPPWYPRRAEYRWWDLTAADSAAGSTAVSSAPGSRAERAAARLRDAGGAAASERMLLAPPWLISADNSLGHRYTHSEP